MEGVAIPLPCCDSSSDEEATQTEPEREKTDSVSGLTALRVEDALRAIVEGREHRASDKLLSLSYWREIGCQDGLHVLEIEPDEQPVYPAESIPKMRTSLLQRGYLMGDACVDADVLLRLSKGMKTLRRLGLAPTFIYVFDEAWVVLERCWRILAQMLDATDVRRTMDACMFYLKSLMNCFIGRTILTTFHLGIKPQGAADFPLAARLR
ncbi:MAG: hypothetical protein SGPRY_000177 [Prymnesium sp.]